jgi:3-(3-hydroxy-phenyl)propionate hydroxylase
MAGRYVYPRYAARPAPELSASAPARHEVAIVGAGPVGLAMAIDLAQQGQRVVLLDEDDTVSLGSRGLCWAKRTLEIFDRLGVGEPIVAKGATWNVGRTYHGTREVFNFNLLPEPHHHRPGMVNLQQYWVEQFLVERALALPLIDLRFKSRVSAVEPLADGARVQVESAHGSYSLQANWLVVADGARSPVRRALGLDMEGQVFKDRFLIADVLIPGEHALPHERWFWFDPPFHPGLSALLHRAADGGWRVDFQLGWDADPEAEKQPERVVPRIRQMLAQIGGGADIPFEVEWASVYTFQCRRMQRLRHGRLLFVGDAAHQVSPFGARGANSGVQDADNLAWKLRAVIEGRAPEALLDSYEAERSAAADENISNSTRSTDFLTPKSTVSHDFRNAVLGLAAEHPFARALVNSGRLSVPTHLVGSPLNTPDADAFAGVMHPGAPLADAPLRGPRGEGWLLQHVGGRFELLWYRPDPAAQQALAAIEPIVPVLAVDDASDPQGVLRQRLDLQPNTAYLLRPDQHVAARWRAPTPALVRAALDRAHARVARPA